MIRALIGVVRRELRLARARRSEWVQPLVFFAIVTTLFALGAEPNDPRLAAVAAAVVWLAALLSGMLGLERLFRDDYEDGTLEQLLLCPQPTGALLTAKLLAHWALAALPIVVLAPLAAAQLGLARTALPVLATALLLGTPTLTLLGGFAAALTVGLPRAGVLLPVLVLPLLVPVLIFGAGAARAVAAGLPASGPLYFLAAVLVLALTLVPWAAGLALRNALE